MDRSKAHEVHQEQIPSCVLDVSQPNAAAYSAWKVVLQKRIWATLMDNKLRMRQQPAIGGMKGRYTLGCINDDSTSKSRETIIPLHVTPFRTTSQIPCPAMIFPVNKDKTGKVYQRVTRMIRG